MARELYTYNSGEIVLVPGTRKCIIGVHIGNDHYVRALLKKFSIGANGNVAAGKGIYWRLCQAIQSMAAGTVVNPGFSSLEAAAHANAGGTRAIEPFTVGKHSFTLPTTGVRVLREGELHNNAGLIIDGFPRGEEPDLLGMSICYWLDALLPAAETACSVTGYLQVEE